MVDQLNTHWWDGKLDKNLLKNIDMVKELSLDQKKEKMATLLPFLSNKLWLEQIINDAGTENNFDQTNGLVAEDLVCLSSDLISPDFIFMLEEQLNDMVTGFCSQGRTHRLFQLVLAFQN